MLTVYSKDKCPACDQAKAYLNERKIDHKVIMIVADNAKNDDEISRVDFLNQNPMVRNVPYIVGDDGEVYRTVAELKQKV